MMAETIPIKPGDTQPRSRRNHRSISDRIFRACTQGHEILGFESINAVGEGFEIVNQSDGLELEHSGEFRQSIVHARLEILLLPPRTGPATPKHALCTGIPSDFTKFEMMSGKPVSCWLM